MQNIPIVIVAYNRPVSLKRLLNSVTNGVYSKKVKLIIDIDGGDNADVLSIAENFCWAHGEKEVIYHKTNLGLRNHILLCGDLTLNYDGIVLLEDDLYVSPYFYEYATQALKFYHNDDFIAGISLYSHRYNETACLPFIPISDDSDVYFLQIASSWGQAWTKNQWERFRIWYRNPDSLLINDKTILPNNILNWPETSWKKYFIKYMIENNLFFVYPQLSYTTNFGDVGIHHLDTDLFQVPLVYNKIRCCFKKFRESTLIYDSFCEIIPECLNHFTDLFKDYHYTVDLFGMKPVSIQSEEYVLTTRNCTNPIFSFGLKLIPAELNVFENITGNSIFFTLRKNTGQCNHLSINSAEYLYYYRFCNTFVKDYLRELETCGQIRKWAERTELFLQQERETSSQLREWAERTELFLQQERETSSQLREWAERTELFLQQERETSSQLREWAERTELPLAKENKRLTAYENEIKPLRSFTEGFEWLYHIYLKLRKR